MIAIDTALYLADYLVRNGLQRVYVVPDPEAVDALNAFRLRGLTIVPTPDATAGTMLAAAESAVRQAPGVILSGSGPSAAEVAPAAVQAQIERRALIAITIEPNGRQARSTARRTLDLRGIFASVSKGSYRLSADNATELVPLAWRLATMTPRGVVHLRVLSDELTNTVPPARGQAHPPAPPPNGEYDALLRQAAEMITSAQRITLLLGPETIEGRAETAARLLAEQWSAPIVVTPMAKGAVPESDPFFAGVYGASGDHPIVELIEESDLVVGLGVSSADFARPWRTTVPTIHLTQAGGPDAGFPAEVVLLGPLNALANDLPRERSAGDNAEARAGQTRRAVQAGLLAREPNDALLTPRRVLDELRRVAARAIPLAVETDAAGLFAAQAWSVSEPGDFLMSNGLGLAGSGLALAIAASGEQTDEPVAWLGLDTSLAARPSLLAHVRDLGHSLPLITINQGVHVELRRAQESAGYPLAASEYQPINLEALAGAYGISYSCVRVVTDLGSTLATALTADRPVLVEIAGDRDRWWHLS